MEMPIAYFKPENQEEIWADISQFRLKHPDGKLAKITLKDFDLYYNQWGPPQRDTALEAVVGVFKNVRGFEWFAYRDHGRWLVGFYQEDTENQIQEGLHQLEIKTQGQKPVTRELKKSERTVNLNPAKVEAEIEYVTVDSIEELFKE